MTELLFVPEGLKDIIAYYGDPGMGEDPDADFLRLRTEVYTLPFPMRASWNDLLVIRRVRAHTMVGAAIMDALTEILMGHGLAKIKAEGWDELGGVYNFRKKTGKGGGLSTHAWGIAIDLCPRLGPYGDREAKFPKELSEPFTRRGFYQLPHDKQHFQGCRGY